MTIKWSKMLTPSNAEPTNPSHSFEEKCNGEISIFGLYYYFLEDYTVNASTEREITYIQ